MFDFFPNFYGVCVGGRLYCKACGCGVVVVVVVVFVASRKTNRRFRDDHCNHLWTPRHRKDNLLCSDESDE